MIKKDSTGDIPEMEWRDADRLYDRKWELLTQAGADSMETHDVVNLKKPEVAARFGFTMASLDAAARAEPSEIVGQLEPVITDRAAAAQTDPDEQDPFACWLAEYCKKDEQALETSAALSASWLGYANGIGAVVGDQKWFSQTLQKGGFEKTRQGGTGRMAYRGIRLIVVQMSDRALL